MTRHSVLSSEAAYERMSSSLRGSVESSPRRVLIATGKNVRKALITATGIHTGSPWPPSQITTIGAIARIGTVCEPTTYGWKPRRRRFEKWKTTPIAMPTTAPMRKPAAASRAVKSAFSKRSCASGGCSVAAGSHSLLTMSCNGGIAYASTLNGFVQPVER